MPQTPAPTIEVPIVPKEYGGKWIAWDPEGTRIIACGSTLSEAAEAARNTGCKSPRFEKVPRPDVRIIGKKL
jgi:hypothetical protein